VPLVFRASLVARQQSARLLRRHRASSARQVRRDLMVSQDHPANLVCPAHLDHQAKTEAPVNLVHPVHLDLMANPDQTAPEETQESQARRAHQSPESQEVQASPDPPDLQDHLDRPDPTDKPEAQDRRDNQAPLDPLERTASPAKTDPLDHPDRPARRVSAPSTARSTVESSSKMEHDAKHILNIIGSPSIYHCSKRTLELLILQLLPFLLYVHQWVDQRLCSSLYQCAGSF